MWAQASCAFSMLSFLSALIVFMWPSRHVRVSSFDLTKVDIMLLEMFQGKTAWHSTIKERDLREALDNCVAAIKSDALDDGHIERLLGLLSLVIDDRQRFLLFEDVERALVESGDNRRTREVAGLLGANLAQAMDRPGRHAADPSIQEAFFRHSIRTFPENPVASRSLGYKLEQSGQEQRAMELYLEGLVRDPERLDLRLLLASSCSPFLNDMSEGIARHARVSGGIGRLRHDIQTSTHPLPNVASPGRDLAYIPSFSWAYLGHGMRSLMESLCWILAAITAGLHEAAEGLHPQAGWASEGREGLEAEKGLVDGERPPQRLANRRLPTTAGHRRIVLGVVMERHGNRSPHRLIQGVLEGLDRAKFRLVMFTRDYVTEYCDAGQALLKLADEVLILAWHPFAKGLADPFADRRVVSAAQVDVLLYTALGNTLWSHLLALGRLAPVQIAFGHGHPVTSGSPGIDYFVSSDRFEKSTSIDAREIRRVEDAESDGSPVATTADACDYFGEGTGRIVSEYGQSYPHRKLSQTKARYVPAEEKSDSSSTSAEQPGLGGDGPRDYVEQHVLFDSLTASLPEPHGPVNAPSSAVEATLAAVGSSAQEEKVSLLEGDHLYHCIQHSKKFHPDFDVVLWGVLQSDPAAKILLAAGSEVHLTRWERTFGPGLTQRLVFLPFLAYPEMLIVVANCRLMLDTFPWGAGVTSMEALLSGVPVVTLPARISVLPLAHGQLVELGVEDVLVATTPADLVKKAVKIASDSVLRDRVSATILDRKHRLSDPFRATSEWERFLERAVRSTVQPRGAF